MSGSDSEYYELVCKICDGGMRCKQKWRNMCADCYKLTRHADKYHRCSTCGDVVKKYKDFKNCYPCFDAERTARMQKKKKVYEFMSDSD